MRGHQHDTASAPERVVENRPTSRNERHRFGQVAAADVWHPQQVGEIAATRPKDALRDATQLVGRRLLAHHLSDVGDDIFAIGRRQPKEEVTQAFGKPVTQKPWRHGSDPREDDRHRDAELVAKLAPLFPPEADARSLPQRALTASTRLWHGLVARGRWIRHALAVPHQDRAPIDRIVVTLVAQRGGRRMIATPAFRRGVAPGAPKRAKRRRSPARRE